MKIAVDIDNIPVDRDGRAKCAAVLPIVNASKRKADIILYTQSIAKLDNKSSTAVLLNLIPGKATLCLGRPEADIYLGA